MKAHHILSLLVFCCVILLYSCSSNKNDEEIYPIYKITVEPESLSLIEGESFQLSTKVLPTNNTDYTITWESNNSLAVSVDQNGLIKGVQAGNAIITATVNSLSSSCTVSVKKHIPTGAIDIGLSVYWAECNIGASKPDEFGYYYAWGEVISKSSYDRNSYRWLIDGRLSKYCPTEKQEYWGGSGVPDNLLVLESTDDVASVILGEKWHIPTYDEMSSLIDTQNDTTNYEWTWLTINGHYGWRVTYKKNGNNVFFPAAGFGGSDSSQNVFGAYWTSCLYQEIPEAAAALHFREPPYGAYFNEGAPRYNGFSIRAVTASQ